jgi:hypothetical protein
MMMMSPDDCHDDDDENDNSDEYDDGVWEDCVYDDDMMNMTFL